MRIYRVSKYTIRDGHQGFTYHTSRVAAEQAIVAARGPDDSVGDLGGKLDAEITTIDFRPTRAGIVALLNAYGSHPDNG